MSIRINENFSRISASYLFSEIAKRVSAYSAEHPDAAIIRMGIGDVTQPLAPVVVEAMMKASAEMGSADTFRGYPPEYGYDFLREAIAKYYAGFGVTVSPSEVYASDGAKSDVGNIVDIFGHNTMLLPDPIYPVYHDSNIMAGNDILFLDANAENGFLPAPPKELTGSYVIYLCSPNNPTGAVYNREQLGEWVDYANTTGSVIIFDGAYEAFISGDLPHSIYSIEGARRCAIEICSFSKMSGFTGTRCSWTIVPDELVVDGTQLSKLWARRQATKFNGTPYVIQRAAEAALSPEGLAQCRETVRYYMDNAAVLADVFRRKGVFFTGGENSPYVWIKCPTEGTSWDFFDALLDGVQIVGTPGSGFGKNGEGYFRFTAFSSKENTIEAAKRLEAFLS